MVPTLSILVEFDFDRQREWVFAELIQLLKSIFRTPFVIAYFESSFEQMCGSRAEQEEFAKRTDLQDRNLAADKCQRTF